MKMRSTFEQEIDRWTLQKINSGINTFDDLIISLPGVYPTLVIDSLSRLVYRGHVKESILKDVYKYIGSEDKNISHAGDGRISHPLDYDWRFNRETVNSLIKLSLELTKPDDAIVLLGVTSLYHNSIKIQGRKVVLIDRNVLHSEEKKKDSSFYQCDLLKDNLPKMQASLIIADPPWYEEHFQSFIWAASQLCNLSGHLLLSVPPIGTRHNMKMEINNIVNWSHEVGFHHITTKESNLTYVSPLFERNALRMEGVNRINPEWRRANMLVFSKYINTNVKRPYHQVEDDWRAVNLYGMDIRIREIQSSKFSDPSLISIVKNDIFPTVSKRDTRRNLVDVWTTGNRVFSCDGSNILIIIMDALSKGKIPDIEVAKFLKRSITENEYEKITNTVNQIIQIVEQERREIGIVNWQLH